MKKKLILFMICACLLATGCGGEIKEVKNLDNFTEIAGNNSFTVNDNMNSYTGVTYIEGSKIATIDDVTIEMVIYDSIDNAKKAQERQIESFNSLKSTGASQDKDNGKNYYRYSLISNGYYMVSSRIDNTLIFSKVLLEDKEKVENIFEDMGY